MSDKPNSIVKRLTEFIFYGNYFYGVCVLALMLETEIQLNLNIESPLVYFISFLGTVIFYNYPYLRHFSEGSNDPRAQWYFRNKKLAIQAQRIMTSAFSLCCIALLIRHGKNIPRMGWADWFLIIVFPAAGVLYYGVENYNLRSLGWVKPFIIGFVWAGAVSIYPILYDRIVHHGTFSFSLLSFLLFLKNVMYVSVLAIMFDIKDYVADSNKYLDTIVVKLGLRKIIFYVLFPLPLLGVLTFISYALLHQFSVEKMILIMCPFFLLLTGAYSLRTKKTLLYYLVFIDGLMMAKAVFGILAAYT